MVTVSINTSRNITADDLNLLADILDVLHETNGEGVIDARHREECIRALDGTLAADLRESAKEIGA